MPADDFDIRLVRVEATLEGFQKVMEERSKADRSMYNEKLANLSAQMITLASAHDRLAPLVQVEKIESRLIAAEKLANDLNLVIVPRTEVQTRFEQVSERMETMSGSVRQLDANLLKLTTILQEDDTNAKIASERTNTRRSQIFGGVATFCALAGIGVSLFLGIHDHSSKPTVILIPPITTTTLAGR
jgi:hypothetical protein